MINRNRSRVKVPSFIPKFSDPDIFKSVINSDIWRHLFLGENRALWVLFKGLLFLKLEMFISPSKSFLRYNHGKRTMGIFIVIASTIMMVAFNTKNTAGYLATFFPLVAPVLPFFMSKEQILESAFVEIRSETLLYFSIAYVGISLIHLLVIYCKRGIHHLPNKRGTSILFVLIFRFLRVPEYLVQRFIEPMIVAGAGLLFIHHYDDFTLGLFLIIAAACLFFQECYDGVLKFSIKP